MCLAALILYSPDNLTVQWFYLTGLTASSCWWNQLTHRLIVCLQGKLNLHLFASFWKIFSDKLQKYIFSILT